MRTYFEAFPSIQLCERFLIEIFYRNKMKGSTVRMLKYFISSPKEVTVSPLPGLNVSGGSSSSQ